MVPKVAGRGRSFKGAGLYYLHDKKADTRQRVAYTHTENLPTRDPDKAIKCMAWTTMRQNELKARSGASTRGRKLTDPVYCYSLSWHPDEVPDQQGMIEAAKASLRSLGLERHEALFVGHNDEPHPHIHVIVNRVNPETGIAAKLSKDFLRLSRWAQDFETAQGVIRCEQRVINNELRRQGEFAKDRASQHSAEFHRWRQERAERNYASRQFEKSALFEKHDAERTTLRGVRDGQLDQLRQRLRDRTRADWRDLFAIHGQERRRLEAAQRNAWQRLRLFVKNNAEKFRTADRMGRRALLKDALLALIGSRQQFVRLERKQRDERVFFSRKLRDKVAPAARDIRAKFEEELSKLKKQQARERHEQRFRHAHAVRQEREERRSGKDRKAFEAEKPETKSGLSTSQNVREQFRRAGGSNEQEKSAPPREQSSDDRLREKFGRASRSKDDDGNSPTRKPKDRDRDREPD